MTPVELSAIFVLLSIIAVLTTFLIMRRCKQEEPTAELETMYDYTPGVPPPKAIRSDAKSGASSKWSFLWT